MFKPILKTAPDPKRMELFAWMCKKIESMRNPLHKRTETDEVITYTYGTIADSKYDEKIKMIKENHPSTVVTPHHEIDPISLSPEPSWQFKRVSKHFLTVLYDKHTGKISLSDFEVGMAYNHKIRKYYPLKKNRPIFCYSDKLYTFIHPYKKSMKVKVMPVTGALISESSGTDKLTKLFAEKLYDLDRYEEDITLPITLKYYEGTTNEYEVIEKRMGIKIPKRLRAAYKPYALYQVLRVLRNKNEITTLNMWAVQSKNSSVGGLFECGSGWYDRCEAIYRLMALHMLNHPSSSWLIRDWVKDHIKLGKKLSLTVRSKIRIEDEHQKMSREISRKELSPIKVAKNYLKMYKAWPIPNSELITTRERLREESDIQQHCVATYGNQINSGSCAIISILYNEKRYTLQVARVTVGKNLYDYRNAQLRGYRNEDAPKELHDLIDKFFLSIRHPFDKMIPSVQKNQDEYEDLPF